MTEAPYLAVSHAEDSVTHPAGWERRFFLRATAAPTALRVFLRRNGRRRCEFRHSASIDIVRQAARLARENSDDVLAALLRSDDRFSTATHDPHAARRMSQYQMEIGDASGDDRS